MRTIALRLSAAVILGSILAVILAIAYVLYFVNVPQQERAVGRESIWCNERYLPAIDARAAVANSTHLSLAKKGYLYALLGAYALQRGNQEGQEHFFELPPRVREVAALGQADTRSGFEVSSFEIYDQDSAVALQEVVIAFSGTNDRADWFTNFSLDTTQYEQAIAYVQRVAAAYPGRPVVLSGYSLGGALATHVTKHAKTRNLITAAWLFNPSPKTWSDSAANPKIWQAATTDDILKIARLPVFRMLPGVADTGALGTQKAENFYLIQSNPVHAHFRWALARNVLHLADLALYKESQGQLVRSEPLEILQRSRFTACPKA